MIQKSAGVGLTLVAMLTGMAVLPWANARETKSNGYGTNFSNDGGSVESPSWDKLPLLKSNSDSKDQDKSSQSVVVDGQVFTPGSNWTLPPVENVLKSACKGVKSANSLCSDQKMPEALKSYEAAARALGIPAQGLICLTKIESAMVAGAKSPAGAMGLTQFMPATADRFQSIMRESVNFQKAWSSYKVLGGTGRATDDGSSGSAADLVSRIKAGTSIDSQFSAKDIVSTDLKNSDVQIFATAMYWRYFLNGTEKFWSQQFGSPSNPSQTGLTHMFHYLLVAYNAGGQPAKKYLTAVKNGSARTDSYDSLPIPKETKGYLKNFDTCLAGASKH